jgi:hypothetical protein
MSTLGLTGSWSRLRALPRDSSTTMRSLSSECLSPASSHTTALPLQADRPPLSCTRSVSGGDRGKEGKMARVTWEPLRAGFVHARIAHHRPSPLWAELGPGGRVKSRPRPSPYSENSVRAGPGVINDLDQTRISFQANFWLKEFWDFCFLETIMRLLI